VHKAEAAAQHWGGTTYHGRSDPDPGSSGADLVKAAPAGHLTYAPGLDGVRAFAVTAVVVFHLGATWLGGGFLGVDVFFVLSGFLITSILLTEFYARGRIDIKNFYLRRARRLLPALFTMLAVITLVTWVFARDELHRLRGDVIAALTYCTNWTQIVWNRGYFDQLGRPSLLQHLWSLAVEEQFYLVWPLLLVGGLAIGRRWLVPAIPVVLTGVSLLLMASMFHVGVDPHRVYYGTDTHISPMLVGAAVAVVVVMRRHAGLARDTARGRAIADIAALIGFLGLAWACVKISYYSPGLYQGGYLFIGIGSAALIYAAAHAGTITARLLGWAPLVWIGKRSYAIYLWHWPILMLTRPGVDLHWPKPVIIVLQVAVILIASDLSFRYIERPIRSRGFMNFLRGGAAGTKRTVTTARGGKRPVTVGAVLTAVLALVVISLGTAPAQDAGIQVDHSKSITIKIPNTQKKHHSRKHHHRKKHRGGGSSTPKPKPPPPFPQPVRVSFFGDSQGMTLLLNQPNGLQNLITTSDSTVEGCGVLLGTITSRVGYTRSLSADCGNWPQLWKANAAKNNPQIAVVEIGAWDVFDDTLNGTTMKFGSPAWNTYFSKQLAKAVSILLDSGAQVALMGVPCYRPIAAGGLPLLPERGDDARTRHLNVTTSPSPPTPLTGGTARTTTSPVPPSCSA
jgi:peptidoglycan/LPS O-acetylase OafA/YrhL